MSPRKPTKIDVNINDSRFTAYALDELDDARACREIEALLARSADARRALEDIRQAAAKLEEELAQEPMPAWPDARQQALKARVQVLSATGRRWWRWAGGLAAAAALFLAVALTPLWQARILQSRPTVPVPTELSQRTPPTTADPRTESVPDTAPRLALQLRRPLVGALDVDGKVEAELDETVKLDDTLAVADDVGVEGGMIGGLPVDMLPMLMLPPQRSVSRDPLSLPSIPELESRALNTVPEIATMPSVSAPPPALALRRDIPRMARFNTEAYDRVEDNPFLDVRQNPLSTFSIDVDTASYANVRRFINSGRLPPRDAVRIEEMINYFHYDDPQPDGEAPFSVSMEVAPAPWMVEHQLLRIGLKGAELEMENRPPSNLVFLLDVSGSMRSANKLPLVKKSIGLLVEKLDERDRVAIVVYAGASGLALPSTSCDQKATILGALERLGAGGSTNGGAGITLAYQTAAANFRSDGINRVILATDGDFNIGLTDQGGLTRLIEEKARSGVFLSVLGFGMGNYKDSTLEKLADRGNGNYAYIDTLNEARKHLVHEMDATLVTIAKDVKIQIEFNPAQVGSYRLIGYENRVLRAEDFNDDRKDAGEIGAGHSLTALYEIVPAGGAAGAAAIDPLKYQQPRQSTPATESAELLTLKLRYKAPHEDTSRLLSYPLAAGAARDSYAAASENFKLAAAVASFGMLLRDSPHKGSTTMGSVLELATEAKGQDRHGYRAELLELIRRARDR